MRRTMLKSKIHRATVTDCDLHYVGSITVDPDLLEAADIREFEQVAVVDVDNGARFETYTIAGEPGSGDMKVNGAAARLVHRGDTIIVISYGSYDPEELEHYRPRVVHVGVILATGDVQHAGPWQPGQLAVRRRRADSKKDRPAVDRVRRGDSERVDREMDDAAPDLLVRVERDLHRAVRDLGMRSEIGDRRHDLRRRALSHHIAARVSPIALRVEGAKEELILRPGRNTGDRHCDLARDERLASNRRFVVEENSV